MSSFGEELKRERELRRITLREVADATKINLRYLEALDKNDFKHLPGGVFNRGFVRAYAQFIGIDPDQMVSAYLMEEQAQTQQNGGEIGDALLRGTRPQLTEKTDPDAPNRSGLWLKVGLAVLLAAVLIAGSVFVYVNWFRDAGAGEETGAADLPKTQSIPASSAPLETVERRQAGEANPEPALPGPGDEVTRGVELPPTPAVPAVSDARALDTSAPAEARAAFDSPASTGSGSPTAAASVQATVFVDRETTGRLNCDNRQIDLLNGMPPGTRFELSCSTFLIVDAADGGALRIAWPGVAPTQPGESGLPLEGYRIDVPARMEERP